MSNILYHISSHKDMTKLDVRKMSGYSMSTVIKYVDKLSEQGLITIGEKHVKSGKTPAQINIDPDAYMLGIGYYRGKLTAVRCLLGGEIKHMIEQYCDNVDTKTVIDIIDKVKLPFPPKGVGLIADSSDIDVEAISKAASARVSRADIALGLADFYRFYNYKSNVEIAVVYVDEKIRVIKSGETTTYYEVGSLYSPIMNSTIGRLTFQQVLAEANVVERLQTKYSANIAQMETAFDNSLFAYRERLELALAELVGMIDKMIKPAVIVVGGSYVCENVISKIHSHAVKSQIVFAGDAQDAIGAAAATVALQEIYEYDKVNEPLD